MDRPTTLTSLIIALALFAASACELTPVPIPFDPPGKTSWAPDGCRAVPTSDPVLGPRTHWHNLHADALNSDEVSIAIAPMLKRTWHADPLTFNYGGPVFDKQGNLYFTPLLPAENVVLISLDPSNGSRRWSVAGGGTGGGGGTPMVLEDPDNPGEEIVYVGLYDRAFAVRTNGSIVWDVSTGLTPTGDFGSDTAFGVNYLPGLDAIVGITGDGNIYALDRASGTSILSSLYQLPGEPSPPGIPTLPDAILQDAFTELTALMGNLPVGFDVTDLVGMLLGNKVEVANFFSIDPNTGRLWVAATAPDAEDGTLDGFSEVGALYGLDLVHNGGGYEVQEACHRYFPGGSASTPSLRADGTRIYLGDASGSLIALDSSCNDVWSIPIGDQVAGSVGVASDNGELYVSGAQDIVQVIDLGTHAVEGWRADLEVYTPGLGQVNLNSNLYSIGANGIAFQSGAGALINNTPLLFTVGVGMLDRGTGEVRYFIDSLDETIAVMSTGPDGALYIGSSPLRRAFTRAIFGDLVDPLQGGVRKFAVERADLLIRDATCAAAARALNADANSALCPDSSTADLTQIQELIDQSRATSVQAIAEGSLPSADWTTLDASLSLAEGNLTLDDIDVAAGHLDDVCAFFD